MNCPNCGAECERDEVDVGVGTMPAGPWGCPECHWVEPTDLEAMNRLEAGDEDEHR